MSLSLVLIQIVRHRLDDLENIETTGWHIALVRHRLDDLERLLRGR